MASCSRPITTERTTRYTIGRALRNTIRIITICHTCRTAHQIIIRIMTTKITIWAETVTATCGIWPTTETYTRNWTLRCTAVTAIRITISSLTAMGGRGALQHDSPGGQQVDVPQHTAVGCWPVSGQQRSPAGQQISPGGQQISQLQGVEPIG
jgi:hypothetical protein